MASSLEALSEIKLTALLIEPHLVEENEEAIGNAKANYRELVDRFYRENEEMMAPQQYEVAKEDFEYFMRLVDLATAFYLDEG